jgi:uncharacterized protein YabE (DUF348 family)
MKPKLYIPLGLVGLLLVAALLLALIPRSYTVSINGETQTLTTAAWRVGDALQQAGLSLQPEDQLAPPPQSWLLGVKTIQIELARPVNIQVQPAEQGAVIFSAERVPGNLLALAGIAYQEDDRLLVNGNPASFEEQLPYTGAYHLQLKRAVTLTIEDAGASHTINSSAANLAKALEEAGIALQPADRIEPGLETTLDGNFPVTIHRARPITITLKEEHINTSSAALSVGSALAEAGLALQGLDYSIPAETNPLPDDGQIRVVRVREETELTQTSIPFTNEYIQSDQVELDKTEVVIPGEFGLEVTHTRIRFEDGQETSRSEEVTWVAKQPQTQQIGRGTQVVVRTMDTPEGTIEYWRAVNVYVTSYSPCRSGVDRCYYGTSSGLPVQHGVISVTRSWYNLLVGQRLYVPGYGTGVVADTGGGVAGQYWIDVGYSDADFVAWHHNVTVYFLTPVPDNIPWILP